MFQDTVFLAGLNSSGTKDSFAALLGAGRSVPLMGT